jgi:hypothetical protein
MSWTVRAEVERVVADLLHWRRLGIVVLSVDPLDGPGVRVGVQHAHPLVTRAMRARYQFPVECRQVPVMGDASDSAPAVLMQTR